MLIVNKMKLKLTILLILVFQSAQSCPIDFYIPNTLCHFQINQFTDPLQCDSTIIKINCHVPICHNKNCSDNTTAGHSFWDICTR